MNDEKITVISEPEYMPRQSTALATPGTVVLQPLEFTEEQKAIIKRMCQAEGLDDNEFAAFMHICKRRRLDPILRQIYATKRNKKIKEGNTEKWIKILVPIVAIEGMTAIADRSGTYAPAEKKPEFEYAKDGDKLPRACTVWVKKLSHGTWHEFSFTAYFGEFVQDTDLWKKMPHHMLMKCARAGALRMGWPEDCGGLYIEEEWGSDTPSPEDTAPERKKRERASMGKLKESKEANRGHGGEGISEALNIAGVQKGSTAFNAETYRGNVIEVKQRESRTQNKQWLEVGVGEVADSGEVGRYTTFYCWHKSLFDCLMNKPKDVVLSVKMPSTHKGYPTIEDVVSVGDVKYEKGEPYREPEKAELKVTVPEEDPKEVRSKSLLELSKLLEELWPAKDEHTRPLRNRVGQAMFNLQSKDQLMELTFPQENIDAAIRALTRYRNMEEKPRTEQGIVNEICLKFEAAKEEIEEERSAPPELFA